VGVRRSITEELERLGSLRKQPLTAFLELPPRTVVVETLLAKRPDPLNAWPAVLKVTPNQSIEPIAIRCAHVEASCSTLAVIGILVESSDIIIESK